MKQIISKNKIEKKYNFTREIILKLCFVNVFFASLFVYFRELQIKRNYKYLNYLFKDKIYKEIYLRQDQTIEMSRKENMICIAIIIAIHIAFLIWYEYKVVKKEASN